MFMIENIDWLTDRLAFDAFTAHLVVVTGMCSVGAGPGSPLWLDSRIPPDTMELDK